ARDGAGCPRCDCRLSGGSRLRVEARPRLAVLCKWDVLSALWCSQRCAQAMSIEPGFHWCGFCRMVHDGFILCGCDTYWRMMLRDRMRKNGESGGSFFLHDPVTVRKLVGYE